MAITLTNNWIIVPENEPVWIELQQALTRYIKAKQIRTKKRTINMPAQTLRAYTRKDGYAYIPVGLYPFFTEYLTLGIEVDDKRSIKNTKLLQTEEYIKNLSQYENILPGITLRTEQLIAIKKILFAKRGIIQISTGGGKSEVMCATCSILKMVNDNKFPTILIFEPTVKLVTDTVKRFAKYGLPAVAYSKTRTIQPNMINIAHPKSLGNDLEKNSNLLNDVEVLFGDECHHWKSDTYRVPTYDMPNLVYSIGVSASAIDQSHINYKKLIMFSYDELLVMGATGPLLLNVTAEHMIDQGNLAVPILMRLENQANEPISRYATQDWHEISKKRLGSAKRNNIVCNAARQFSEYGRKVLILVNTIEWSRNLLTLFDNYGLSDKVFASYGSGKFEYCYNGKFYSDKKDYFEDFDSGKYTIMIGTTHLYEGADLKQLDTIILAFGGKAERLQVQGIGRALRKSKTGKFAYIVDFTDDEDRILAYQSKVRFKRYKDIFGIPNDNIYNGIQDYEIEKILTTRENIAI